MLKGFFYITAFLNCEFHSKNCCINVSSI